MNEQTGSSTVISFKVARERRKRAAAGPRPESNARPRLSMEKPVRVTLGDGTVIYTRVGDVTCDGLKLRTDRVTADALHPSGQSINLDNPPKVEVTIDLPLQSADLRLNARCSIARYEQVAPDAVTLTLYFLNFAGAGGSVLRHYVRLRSVPVRSDTSRASRARGTRRGEAN